MPCTACRPVGPFISQFLDTAAELLIALPWHKNMLRLSSLLKLPVYLTNMYKRTKLLHHPNRGAVTELQVLAVLENLGIPRADCASALEVQKLQPAELQGLFAALVDSKKQPGQLLHAAAQQQLVPEVLQTAVDWSKNVRIVHNIMLPDPGSRFLSIALRECKLKLTVEHRLKEGKVVSVLSKHV